MVTLDEFSELVSLIAGAGLDFERWPTVLEHLSEALEGSAAAIGKQNIVLRDGAIVTVRADPIFDRLYAEHYAERNILWERCRNRQVGTCITDRQVMPVAEFSRTEFYNEFLLPQDVHSSLSAFVLAEDDWGAVVSIGRSPRRGEWEAEHLELMNRLAPHLHRAAQVNLRLGEVALREGGAVEALNKLGHGVIIASGDSKALFVNRAASEIVGVTGGLRIEASGLRTDKPAETVMLRKLIAAAVTGGVGAQAAGGMMTLSRPLRRRPLAVLVSPFNLAGADWFTGTQRSAAILFIVDPERAPTVPEDYLRRLYGLTAAEATVAVQIVRGEGLQAVADNLRVTLSTVRTHLQRVFEKTQTRRQAELTRVVAESVAGISLDKFPF